MFQPRHASRRRKTGRRHALTSAAVLIAALSAAFGTSLFAPRGPLRPAFAYGAVDPGHAGRETIHINRISQINRAPTGPADSIAQAPTPAADSTATHPVPIGGPSNPGGGTTGSTATDPGSGPPPATEPDEPPTTAGPPPTRDPGPEPTTGGDPAPTGTGSASAGPAGPTSHPSPSATPAVAGMPGPSPTPRATSSSATGAAAAPYGVANPGRVPADGSQPRLDRAAGGANSADPAAPENVDAIAAAGWTSMLPGPEVGIKIFVAGLIALVIAISGLVTVALRRRDPS